MPRSWKRPEPYRPIDLSTFFAAAGIAILCLPRSAAHQKLAEDSRRMLARHRHARHGLLKVRRAFPLVPRGPGVRGIKRERRRLIPPLKGATCWKVMTWLAELKPNTALNRRRAVDGSRERKGARRQRFLIQINTEPRLSAPLLLSHIDGSSLQWRFQRPLGGSLALDSSRLPNNFLAFPSAGPLLVYSRRIFAFLPSFHAAFIDSPPRRRLPWSPGSSFLVAQKTPVTDCLPPVRLRISRAITTELLVRSRLD